MKRDIAARVLAEQVMCPACQKMVTRRASRWRRQCKSEARVQRKPRSATVYRAERAEAYGEKIREQTTKAFEIRVANG